MYVVQTVSCLEKMHLPILLYFIKICSYVEIFNFRPVTSAGLTVNVSTTRFGKIARILQKCLFSSEK